jgi:hypothetical protein
MIWWGFFNCFWSLGTGFWSLASGHWLLEIKRGMGSKMGGVPS